MDVFPGVDFNKPAGRHSPNIIVTQPEPPGEHPQHLLSR